MYIHKFKPIQNFLFEEGKLATKSFLLFGSFLVLLAGLIFMFPAIVGILFAVIIFLTGLFTLVSGYYIWQARAIQTGNLNSLDPEFNFIKPSYNRARYYRFQNIRFLRW